jgi:hypothetical protein
VPDRLSALASGGASNNEAIAASTAPARLLEFVIRPRPPATSV